MLLIKESHHGLASNNHGALWQIENDYDENGQYIGLVASFCGNVVCPDLSSYLQENPDVQIASRLPEYCRISHNG